MKKIAVVFDFDNTLTADSTSGYLKAQGIDPEKFWRNDVQQLIDQKWDVAIAYMYCLLEEHKKNNLFLSETSLKNFSQTIDFFPGVEKFFQKIRHFIEKRNENVSVEFYIISSGIGTIIRNCKISNEFTDIWASDFFFSENGCPIFLKNVVSFTDKTRYLFQIQKQLVGAFFKTQPFAVNKKTRKKSIPFQNMIFVGDGYTDVPCFAILQKFGGTPLCVYEAQEERSQETAATLYREGRISGTAPADYTENDQLHQLMIHSIQKIIESN